VATIPGPVTAAHPPAGDSGVEAFIEQCLASTERDLHAEAHRQVDKTLLAHTLERRPDGWESDERPYATGSES
jgi:hypothetical protein